MRLERRNRNNLAPADHIPYLPFQPSFERVSRERDQAQEAYYIGYDTRGQKQQTAAQDQEEIATRKVAKALAKVEEARHQAVELGAKPAQEETPPDSKKTSEKIFDETDKGEQD